MEDCFALHSIWYRRMAEERSYLHVFGVRDNRTGMWWAWEDVELMAANLGLPTAPVLFKGVLESEEQMRALMPGDGKQPSAWGGVPVKVCEDGTYKVAPGVDPQGSIREGEVLRLASSFTNPSTSIVKAVRPGHVLSNVHWKTCWVPQHDWNPLQG